MSDSSRPAAVLVAVCAAFAATASADLSLVIARGTTPVVLYYAACLALGLTSYLLIAGLTLLARGGVVVALSLCAAAEGLASKDPASGASFAIVAAVVLVARARLLGNAPDLRAAGAQGAALGFCIAATLILWPRILAIQTLLEGIPTTAVRAGVLGLGLFAFALYDLARERLAGSLARLPSAALLVPLLILVLFAVIPANLAPRRDRLAGPPAAGSSGLPHVLVLVLDTVRADHLSVYGYGRDTTPKLVRRLAAQRGSTAYAAAYAPSNWTVPSHASLFTGWSPRRHGAHHGLSARAYSYGPMRAEQTLAETMKEAGYATAGIYANSILLRIGGGDRGFDVYYRPLALRRLWLVGERVRRLLFPRSFIYERKPYSDALDVNRGLLQFFDDCLPGPCFAVANYMEAHGPWLPRPPFAGRFAAAPLRRDDIRDPKQRAFAAAYDEEILGLDARIGELLDTLDSRGVLERTWVFVTSDHGEAFGEHETLGHRTDMYDEQVRIPLVVFPPRGISMPTRRDAVGLLDVTATVSRIAGRPLLGAGRDLRDAEAPEQPIRSAQYRHGVPTEPLRAVVVAGNKLIDRHGRSFELYDLKRDPRELDDLAALAPELVASLRSLLPAPGPPAREADRPVPLDDGPRELTPEAEEALRALGYAD